MRELLRANPQNLAVPGQLMRWKDGPALGRLGGIRVPTLIVVGEADIPDVHAHAGALQADISGASRVVLPGSGHLPHMEVPAAFNDTVMAFLGKALHPSAL